MNDSIDGDDDQISMMKAMMVSISLIMLHARAHWMPGNLYLLTAILCYHNVHIPALPKADQQLHAAVSAGGVTNTAASHMNVSRHCAMKLVCEMCMCVMKCRLL